MPGEIDDTLADLRRAIVERRRVAFRYQGRDRIALPLRLGRDGAGQWFVRAVQVAGDSATGVVGIEVPKLFRVERVAGLRVLTRQFTVPAEYEQIDRTIVTVDVELEQRPRDG